MMDWGSKEHTASRLIKKFGAPATLLKKTDSKYDPGTCRATSKLVSFPSDAVVLESREDGQIVDHSVDILMTVTKLPPAPGDSVKICDRVYSVKTVAEIAPAGAPLLYEMKAEL